MTGEAGVARPGRAGRLWRWFLRGIGRAISRFPFAALSIGAICVLANFQAADSPLLADESMMRLLYALGTGAALSVAVCLFGEAHLASGGARLGAGLFAGSIAALLVWFGRDGALFVPPLLAASILAIPLAPHLRGSSPRRFWFFTVWSFVGASLGFLSVLLFVVGVSAIIEMIRYLFDIGPGQRVYSHLFATALTFVGPLFALGRIPGVFEAQPEPGETDRVTAGLGTLQSWIVAPLVLVAAVILHLYIGKIVVTGEVPKNQIGWIVGTYALFVLSLRVACDPNLSDGGVAIRLFARVWTFILLAPTLLLAYAIRLRIHAEGFTGERYFLCLAAAALVLILSMQAIGRLKGDIRWMAAVPVCLLALSSFGPLGVSAVVGRSQFGLIAAEFRDPGGRLKTGGLSGARRAALISRVAALNAVDGLSRLRPLLDDETRRRIEAIEASDRAEFADILEAMDLGYRDVSPDDSLADVFDAAAPAPFDVSGFDLVMIGLWADGPAATAAVTAGQPAVSIADGRLSIRWNGIADMAALSPVGAAVPKNAMNGRKQSEVEPPVVDIVTDGGRRIRLRVLMRISPMEDGTPSMMDFDLAVSKAEWAP